MASMALSFTANDGGMAGMVTFVVVVATPALFLVGIFMACPTFSPLSLSNVLASVISSTVTLYAFAID
jgi:hypothetical protein